MNSNIKKWGNICWKVLINIALQYPEKLNWQQSRQIEMFLYQLQYVLPCEICRNHYHEYLKENKINIHTRKDFLVWLFKLYNTIKKRENYSKTYNEFLDIGSNYSNKYFWELMYYISIGYVSNTFDNQISYKQFFEYLGYLHPMKEFSKAFFRTSIDPYLLNSESLLYYFNILYYDIQTQRPL